MTTEFHIRPIFEADLPAVLEAYRQCEDFLALGPQSKASMDMVLADLQLSRDQGGIFTGIFDPRERLMGVLDYIPAGFCSAPEDAFIELLMIAPPYRNNGLGAAVVSWLEQQVLADPVVRNMRAGVQVNNPDGLRFWQRMGYRVVSEPKKQEDGTTVVDLLKELR